MATRTKTATPEADAIDEVTVDQPAAAAPAAKKTAAKTPAAKAKAPARAKRATKAKDSDAEDETEDDEPEVVVVEVEPDEVAKEAVVEETEDDESKAAPAEALPQGALVLSIVDDEDDVPVYSSAITGATADPVKDYLKQIGKVALLNAAEEVELAMRIEAGLFAEDKLSEMSDAERKTPL
jgi:RNA polymerase primary sigma factor